MCDVVLYRVQRGWYSGGIRARANARARRSVVPFFGALVAAEFCGEGSEPAVVGTCKIFPGSTQCTHLSLVFCVAVMSETERFFDIQEQQPETRSSTLGAL